MRPARGARASQSSVSPRFRLLLTSLHLCVVLPSCTVRLASASSEMPAGRLRRARPSGVCSPAPAAAGDGARGQDHDEATSSDRPVLDPDRRAELSDLRARIRNTRWPDQAPGAAWEQGTDLEYLRALLAYWADEFDWHAQERQLNAFNQFRAELDGVHIHFVHERARRGRGIPLILTHGWPSTFVELLPLVPFLTDPETHGIDGPAFDVVIPSLPGYGFSERPAQTGVNYRYVAGLWHRLMRGLGYERYGAQGGDFGAGVATFMALDDPKPMVGVHLSNLEISPYTGARVAATVRGGENLSRAQ